MLTNKNGFILAFGQDCFSTFEVLKQGTCVSGCRVEEGCQ